MSHIVILGNGIAGITAARHIRKKSDSLITVISGETEHFYSRTALMYIYMGHMKFEHTKPYEDWFWTKNNIGLKKGWVENIDFDRKVLRFVDGEEFAYDKLILATGSKSNKFGWAGQDLEGVQGLYNYQDLQLMEKNTAGIKKAVIVGGGLIGIEMAEMLHSRNISVTYLVRENHFWELVLPPQESTMIENHILEHQIDLRLSTELKEIIDDGTGRVKGIITSSDELINCEFVGLTVGVSPNLDILKNTELATDKGILVNEFLETSIEDVYAIGDCAQIRNPLENRRSVEAVWYTGRMMGETVAKTITGDRINYNSGVWFNSAKFFDIEYQTYGHVWSTHKENESEFYWENPDGKKCLHFIFDKKTKSILGVNALGIRLRHEVMNQWILDNKSIDYVMQHLKDVNFDPELYRNFASEVIKKFNKEYKTSITPKNKSWKRILTSSID